MVLYYGHFEVLEKKKNQTLAKDSIGILGIYGAS